MRREYTYIYVAHKRAKRKGQIWRVVDICETTGWPAIPVARITPITCDRLLYPRFSLLKIYPCSPHANIFHLILKFSTRLIFFLHDVNLFIYICLQEYIYNSNIKREKKNKGIELLNFFIYSFFYLFVADNYGQNAFSAIFGEFASLILNKFNNSLKTENTLLLYTT